MGTPEALSNRIRPSPRSRSRVKRHPPTVTCALIPPAGRRITAHFANAPGRAHSQNELEGELRLPVPGQESLRPDYGGGSGFDADLPQPIGRDARFVAR